jgi:hypothetical protein
MAGSLTWREYTGDDGVKYSIKVDESNARASVTGGAATGLCKVRTTNAPPLPVGLKKRFVNCYSQANPNIRRRFYVGDNTLITSIRAAGATLVGEDYSGAANAPGANATWIVASYRGEKAPVVPAFTATDTGLTDGTAGQ